jgi:hypothetical protein
MMMTMLNIDEQEKSILFVVIETTNLVRMEKADPITLESPKAGGILPEPKYPGDFSVLIAYEPDTDALYAKAKEGGIALLMWLERGRKFIAGLDGKGEAFRVPKTEPAQQFSVTWNDAEREPQCAPDPDYPDGKDVDVSQGAGTTCTVELPHPAKRCGFYDVRCTLCGFRAMITTAGRPDDPKSVRFPCIGRANAAPA